MKRKCSVKASSGKFIEVKKNELITIIDCEGKQVVDFFAESQVNNLEFLSAGVTIDINESLKLKVGNTIYSNLYNPMFTLIEDDVGEHDLIHPTCRREMYDYFYKNGKNHSNCLDNINGALNSKHQIIHPINLFMYCKINPDGSISVEEPLSKAGDKVVLKAEMDLYIGLAACSVYESKCNGGKCTDVEVIVSNIS